jgi:polar amino acid transport system substrate-binding protein
MMPNKENGMKILLGLFFLLGGITVCASAEEFQVLGIDLPPLQYQNTDGQPAGFYFELLQMMLKEMPQTKVMFGFYPAPRMLAMAASQPNTFALGIARNAKRETSYKWVGPSIKTRSALYKLKNRTDLQMTTVSAASPYQIGTGRAYATEEELLKAGIPKTHIQEVTVDAQNIKKLFAYRIDFVATLDVVFWDQLKREGHSVDDVEEIVINTRDMYYAFCPSTDDRVIQQFQAVLDRIKQTKAYATLLQKYVPKK